MSRLIADYQSGKPDDFIKFVSEDFFAKEGFRQVNYKGETVWKKGVGFLTAPSFISFRYSQGNIHLEAWIKSFGEHGLDGFYGAVPKKALKNRVDALMSLLSQDVPVPEGGAAPQPDAAAAPAAPVPVEVHNPTGKATVALVTGILGVLLAFFIPLIGVILSAVAVSSGAVGRKSTNSGRATAGYVLGIIGVVVSILMWLLNIVLTVL